MAQSTWKWTQCPLPTAEPIEPGQAPGLSVESHPLELGLGMEFNLKLAWNPSWVRGEGLKSPEIGTLTI